MVIASQRCSWQTGSSLTSQSFVTAAPGHRQTQSLASRCRKHSVTTALVELSPQRTESRPPASTGCRSCRRTAPPRIQHHPHSHLQCHPSRNLTHPHPHAPAHVPQFFTLVQSLTQFFIRHSFLLT